jgi:hypothetical protein
MGGQVEGQMALALQQREERRAGPNAVGGWAHGWRESFLKSAESMVDL